MPRMILLTMPRHRLLLYADSTPILVGRYSVSDETCELIVNYVYSSNCLQG